MRNDLKSVQNFAGNERGTIAVLFGLTAICMLGFVGLSIDGGRAMGVRSKTDASLDSAALAAARAIVNGKTKEEAEDLARLMFNTNIDNAGDLSAHYEDLVPDADVATRTVKVSVRAVVPTYFGSMFGVPRIEFVRSATATLNINDLELGLALDVTGSMNWHPKAGGDVKIASLKAAASDLIDTLMGPDNVNDVRIGLAPFSASVNLGAYSAAATNNVSADNCAFERTGPNQYTDLSPSDGGAFGAFDGVTVPVDIDPAENNPDPNTYGCPNALLEPLSTDKDKLKTTINSFVASGYTAGHIGASWAWNLVSPEWRDFWPADSVPRDYGTKNLIKAVVFMTDGTNNISYQSDTSDHQDLAICQAMKDKNIMVFTVGFDASAPALDLLTQCASDDLGRPGEKLFYDARDGDALHAAFRDIAIKLTALRLSK